MLPSLQLMPHLTGAADTLITRGFVVSARVVVWIYISVSVQIMAEACLIDPSLARL